MLLFFYFHISEENFKKVLICVKCKYRLIVFVILILFSLKLNAQENADSSSFSQNIFKKNLFTTGLDKQLNTYLFSNYFRYGINTDRFYIGAKEIFNSTIVNSTQKNIKDEHNLFLTGGYEILTGFTAGLTLANIIYSDDRYTQINKTSLLNSTVFLKYSPLKNISISPYLGVSSNQQIDETDNGPIYGAEFNINSLMLSDFQLNSQMKFQNEDISPRKNTLRNISVNLANNIEETFTNTLSVSYSEQQKDFYFSADSVTSTEFNIINNIQSRTETNYYIQDRLKSIPVSEGFSFEALGSIYWRTIDRNTRYVSLSNTSASNYDTQINELRVDIAGGAEYKSKSLFSSFKFTYAQYEEKHEAKKIEGVDNLVYLDREEIEFQKNNQAETATLSLYTNWKLTDNDNIIFSLYHRKLVYDTPSDENYDDRDELLSIGRIGYERKLSPLFRMLFNLEGSLNKIVYIFSERSSNNNVRRFLKFSTSGYYAGTYLTSSNSAEISANYTTYDYEYLNSSLQSYSFRQFTLKDSTTYKISKRIRLIFNGYIKLSEQGNFDWATFSGLPSRYLDERLFEPRMGYFTENLNLSWGIRYFNLCIYSVNSSDVRTKTSDYLSVGPVSEIKYRIGSKIDLTFFGWYEFINGDGAKREVPNVIFKMNWMI